MTKGLIHTVTLKFSRNRRVIRLLNLFNTSFFFHLTELSNRKENLSTIGLCNTNKASLCENVHKHAELLIPKKKAFFHSTRVSMYRKNTYSNLSIRLIYITSIFSLVSHSPHFSFIIISPFAL